MKPVYFISDVHLGAPSLDEGFEVKRKNELLKLLHKVAIDGSRLIIVGDLFDFWFEYKSVIPKDYFWIYSELKTMSDGGICVDYVAGNHDFFLGEFFSKAVGIHVYPDGFSEEINGKKFLIVHGDGLAIKDSNYRMLKKILRNRLVNSLIRWIHPDIGFRLAKAFSKKSREYTSGKQFGELDGMALFAEKRINEGYDYVVMGHNHVPRLDHFGNGVYINVGDWLRSFTYGVFDGDEMQLAKWEFEK